ncbi:MAG: hypothetical protein Q4F97_04780 [Bacteroidales bacterium]|nr:hypothetical protein [Bacteroidales bacterium]
MKNCLCHICEVMENASLRVVMEKLGAPGLDLVFDMCIRIREYKERKSAK